jgi:general secretion pathway protein B
VQAAPPATPSAATPLSDGSAAAAPTALPPALDTLPQDFRQTLPPLHLDVLGYAIKPAERFAVINLRHYRIGDTLAEGPTLKDVLPQGAVLEFHGSVFLLPTT